MKRSTLASSFLLVLLALAGCSKSTPAPNYFKTHFQDESQFIVETILTDVAEMAYYAKHKTLPDPKYFLVEAAEITNSAIDSPRYEVRIRLEKKQTPLRLLVDVNAPIWAPEVYADAAGAIFRALKLPTGTQMRNDDDGAMLERLTDCKAVTIEEINQSLSQELQANFQSPVLHEKAALLLAAFANRERSGLFSDIRLPLCRTTAHLAVADTLANTPNRGVSGQFAEIFLYDGMGNSRAVLDKVGRIQAATPAMEAWLRVFKAWCTLDYRPLEQLKEPLPIERLTLFALHSYVVNQDAAWNALTEEDLQLPDYCRSVLSYSSSVAIGHKVMPLRLPLEYKEINEVFAAARGREPRDQKEAVEALNQMPERCFTLNKNKRAEVKIIGCGQWAMSLQRHLCHAIREHFDFLQNRWGVPDQAQEFAAEMESAFNGLRLYPFVRRFNCMDEAAYHKAVDDAFVVTRETPHLVGSMIWNYLCYKPRFAPLYAPNPNPHINEWHNHNPLPGTVYDLFPRLDHPSLTGRPDLISVLETLHQRSPCNLLVCDKLLEKKYQNKPTYEQVLALYGSTVEYANGPMVVCANAVQNDPEKYEAIMLRVCKTKPQRYFTLAKHFRKRGDEDKAVSYAEQGFKLGDDAIAASYEAEWVISYYLKNGNQQRARELADFAGEVYSHVGLRAKATFLEKTKDYDGAFAWFQKISERYNDPWPLFDFYFRYKDKMVDNRFDEEIKQLEKAVFPKGMEKVSVKKLEGYPTAGVEITGTSDLLTAAGLKQGDIIVALYGYRVTNLYQFAYLRETTPSSRLVLIVWQGDKFREVQASPPRRKFGVTLSNFPRN